MTSSDTPRRREDAGPHRSTIAPDRRAQFRWPPPGLEDAQGRLWSAIPSLALGDLILVVPLLWSVGKVHELGSLGPFGSTWWVTLVTTALGLVMLLEGYARLFRLLRLLARAGDHGHGWLTSVEVAADSPRDTGFLLQGARYYAGLVPMERRALLIARLATAASYLTAVLWVPVGFVLSIMLGGRGVLRSASAWGVTLGPALLLLIVALLGRALEAMVSRSRRRDRALAAAVEKEVRGEIELWQEQSAVTREALRLEKSDGRHPAALRWGAVLVPILAVLVAVPTVTATLTGSFGAVLVSIAVPSFGRTQARLAEVEPLRRYQVQRDPAVGADEAGGALQALMSPGREPSDYELERVPPRTYREPWFPTDPDSLIGDRPDEWVLGLFGRVSVGLPEDERSLLATVASHPAHEEFTRVSRANEIDIVGTRYTLPFPDTLAPASMPLTRFSELRDGARAHVALAAYQLGMREFYRAESSLREVISVGFVLIDEGPTVMDLLLGTVMIRLGADGLERFYEASARTDAAEVLRWVRSSVAESLNRARAGAAVFDTEDALRSMPRWVLDEGMARGIRWEHLLGFTSLAPCANLNEVVFGPGESYAAWLEDARESLVRTPGEAALFDFLQNGWLGNRAADEAPGLLKAVFRFTFGGGGGQCVTRIAALGDLN